MKPEPSKIGVFDYIVVIGILVFSVIIGLYHGYKKEVTGFLHKRKLRKKAQVNGQDIEMKVSTITENNSVDDKNQVSDYLTANGSLGILPVAFSLIATMFSSNTILANPG
jgi:Na+/proline symporter